MTEWQVRGKPAVRVSLHLTAEKANTLKSLKLYQYIFMGGPHNKIFFPFLFGGVANGINPYIAIHYHSHITSHVNTPYYYY